VVFTAFSDPVTRGLVQSVSHPGGNMTGIQRGTTVSQTLEMFQSINPKITKIYVPYNPADAVSVTQVQGLVDIAKTLNLDLSLAEVKTPDEVVTAIKSLSKDTAILLVGVPSLNAGKDAILQAAIAQGIMLGSSSAQSYAQAGALLYFDSDFTALGKQAAGLVDKILQGGNPGDIPIETAETYLAINLKTAQTLGLTIPGNLLQQANSIIR
jgi:putative tryptophan/tyrosine transport system substrate-binding protein